MTWVSTQRQTNPTGVHRAIENLTAEDMAKGGGSLDFALWLKFVDRRMVRAVGVTHRDIGDWTWHDAFLDGLSPAEAARDALAEDDLYGSLMEGIA